MTDVEKYLTLVTQVQGTCDNKRKSIEQFVLDHGVLYGERIERKVRKDLTRIKQCFRNAACLAMDDSALTYVEGWAMSIIPIQHAWCVTRNGRVVDPTWKDGGEYFGVPFRTEWLRVFLLETQVFGVLYVRGIHANQELLNSRDLSRIVQAQPRSMQPAREESPDLI